MPRLFRLLAPLTCGLFALGCGASEGLEVDLAPLDDAEAEIINGELDTVNKAVVQLFSLNASGTQVVSGCSGTIIGRNGKFGYLLTAAHCSQGGEFIILVADRYGDCMTSSGQLDPGGAGCEGIYQTRGATPHPQYNEQNLNYDLLLARFPGAGPNLPVAQIATGADGLSQGAALEVSGFGRFNSGNSLSEDDRRRRAFTVVSQLSSTQVQFPQDWTGPYGGVCNGDSGGPTFSGSGSQKRVVAVNSYVLGDPGQDGASLCNISGGSARLGPTYADYVEPYLGENPGALSCNACVNAFAIGACAPQLQACEASSACRNFETCIEPCGADRDCLGTCRDDNPEGTALYDAWLGCTICDNCESECAGTSLERDWCTDPPTGPGGEGGTGGGGDGGAGGNDIALSSGSGSRPRAEPVDDSGCSVVPTGPSPAPGAPALLLALGALAAVRRRARG